MDRTFPFAVGPFLTASTMPQPQSLGPSRDPHQAPRPEQVQC